MKSIIVLIAAVAMLQSCKYSENTDIQNTDSTTVVYRDSSITPETAYSDLFLDSNAVNSYIEREKLDGMTAQMIRNFYAVRNDQFAWFTSQGLTEEGRNFWTLYASNNDSTSKDASAKGMKEQMDSLLQKDSITVVNTDSNYVRTEIALTHKLVKYAESDNGVVTRSNVYYIVPRKKVDPLVLADSILNKQIDSTTFASNNNYTAMKEQLAVYHNAAKNGGWQPIASASGLKKGAKSPAVTALKKRLQATNDYVTSDTTNVFSDSLVTAVKDVQLRNGLAATGVVNDSLVQVLNLPAQQRLQQVLLNMNRMVWMRPMEDSNRIEVNIPAQMLYAYEGSKKVFEMPVIVGKEGTSTLAFAGKINQVVFNPTWNIPQSIVKNEIMPKMKNDAGYLKKKNMEKVGGSDSVPVLKQLPGKDNPLGKVKFLFPNSFDIYLHDTPDKSLFKRKDRALSHGCIRVADAEKLAQYVLRDNKDWTPEKIRAAMNGNKEETVPVSKTQPVQITALSAWVDASGKINFRNDIHGRDRLAMARMFTRNNYQDLARTTPDTTKTRKDSSGKEQASR